MNLEQIDSIMKATRAERRPSRVRAICKRLYGTKYGSGKLVGGINEKEEFIAVLSELDCVTFCETVISMSVSSCLDEYNEAIRYLRYKNGAIEWKWRNHYLSRWIENGSSIGVFGSVVGEVVPINKVMSVVEGLEPEEVCIKCSDAESAVGQMTKMHTYFVGFCSDKPGLDYFHCGLCWLDEEGQCRLVHASRRLGEVGDENLDDFNSRNKVEKLTIVPITEHALRFRYSSAALD